MRSSTPQHVQGLFDEFGMTCGLQAIAARRLARAWNHCAKQRCWRNREMLEYVAILPIIGVVSHHCVVLRGAMAKVALDASAGLLWKMAASVRSWSRRQGTGQPARVAPPRSRTRPLGERMASRGGVSGALASGRRGCRFALTQCGAAGGRQVRAPREPSPLQRSSAVPSQGIMWMRATAGKRQRVLPTQRRRCRPRVGACLRALLGRSQAQRRTADKRARDSTSSPQLYMVLC